MIAEPERALVLTYAPTVRAAAALTALLALDDRLAQTVRSTSEPMLGQIRLKWWSDALAALDTEPVPAEPVLEGLAAQLLPLGVRGAEVAGIAEAWGELLGGELDAAALERFAARGGLLFALAGRAAGAGDGWLDRAGRGWALADLAMGLSDVGEANLARGRASDMLESTLSQRWSRNARALGAMAHLARLDLAGSRIGSPRRVGRLLWHRLTGR
jgi:phytoene synthase